MFWAESLGEKKKKTEGKAEDSTRKAELLTRYGAGDRGP